MSLREKLFSSEHKPVGFLRRRVEQAREGLADVERRIRQRMRIYPRKLRRVLLPEQEARELEQIDQRLPSGGAGSLGADPETNREAGKPIVSIHGRDVEEEE
jgi:hypothetical protein